MDKALKKAVSILKNSNHTCVICKGDNICTSDLRGIKPLVTWYESNADFTGASAADKVIGKGAAFLYLLLGVKSIYAEVISKPALDLLIGNGIDISYALLTDNIINRSGDGICPFEEALLDINDKAEAYTAICEKMRILREE